jgi:hypothetical protein
MRSAVIKVVPSMPKPVEKDEPKVSEAANLGAYSIKSLSPAGPLLVGRQSKVSVELQYDSAKSGTEVYVALTPTQGGKIITNLGSQSFGAISMSGCKDDSLSAGPVPIDRASKPLYIKAPFLGAMSLAYIGTVPKHGKGEMQAAISFSPPPLGAFYSEITVEPVLFHWNDEGKKCTSFSSSAENRASLALTGREASGRRQADE